MRETTMETSTDFHRITQFFLPQQKAFHPSHVHR